MDPIEGALCVYETSEEDRYLTSGVYASVTVGGFVHMALSWLDSWMVPKHPLCRNSRMHKKANK